MPPQQRVPAGLRSARDPPANRFENLRLPEVGNQQSEQQSVIHPDLPHIRARSRDALHQPALDQLPQRPPDRYPRRAELLHQRRLAGEFLARLILAR